MGLWSPYAQTHVGQSEKPTLPLLRRSDGPTSRRRRVRHLTLVVGLHLGTHAIVAADTRVSYYIDDVFGYEDDSEKLMMIDPGIISGAGLVSLLDNVKHRLDDDELGVIDRIADLVKGEVAFAKEFLAGSDARVLEAIDYSAWMFTFVGVPPDVEPKTAFLRLGLVSADHDYAIAHIPPPDAWLLPPTGTTEEQFVAWRRRLKAAIKPLDKPEDFINNVQYHIDLIGGLMRDVSEVNQGVAPTFQVGVHIVMPHIRLISSIMKAGDRVSWQETIGLDEAEE